MKKHTSLFLILAILFSCLTVLPVHAESSGTCGDNLTWTLDDNGTLTISGTGDMADYSSKNFPWYNERTRIKTLVIEDGVTSIGDNAFYSCYNLTNVSISNSVTSIGDHAFYGCDSLTSIDIPSSVINIGDLAFYGCDSLTSVMIHGSVTNIGDWAFCYCSSLTEIIVNENNTCYSSEDGVLFDKNKTQLIQYPAGKSEDYYSIPNGITSIADYAFFFCSSLTRVDIPNSITSIGKYAFSGCAALTSMSIPSSVTSIGDSTFCGCLSLKSVTIPDSVINIESCAFLYCSNLKIVTIPDSVTNIGNNAFSNCSSLTSVTIPDSVTNIADHAFADTGIYNNEENWHDGILYIDNWLICAKSDISEEYTIKNGSEHIADSAFYNCKNLTNVTIPDSVTSIGISAFRACDKLNDVYYYGTEEQWSKIAINTYNECLTNANIHFMKHIVTYDANGGTSAPAEQLKTVDEDLTLSSDIPTREGYIFLGWATSPSATAADYPAGGSFTLNADTVLYAVWDINTCTITYDPNGGTIHFEGAAAINEGSVLIQAIYNGNELTEWYEYPVSSNSDVIHVNSNFEPGSAKFMLWNNLEEMRPLTDAITQ